MNVKSTAQKRIAIGILLMAICSLGRANTVPVDAKTWAWSEDILNSPNNAPKLIYEKNTYFYALVCVDENARPDGPIKFTINRHTGTRFNKSGCWLDAISDIYLAEGSAKGTITDLGPTSRDVRQMNFKFSNISGEESDILGIPDDKPANVKICIEKMAKAGQIKFSIKYYGDAPPVDRWEIPQFPINPRHLDCPEFRHVVAVWLDRGDGEGNANNNPISGTVYVN
jgi:hypothetical protein